jgi:hypothetical protein
MPDAVRAAQRAAPRYERELRSTAARSGFTVGAIGARLCVLVGFLLSSSNYTLAVNVGTRCV